MNAPQFNGDDEREDTCTEDFDMCQCPGCREWRDNREPGEVDGEDFRGGEAAAYDREQQADAMELKR